MKTRVLIVIGSVLLVAGALGPACTSSNTKDLEARVAAVEQSIGALQDGAQRAQMVATLNVLDGVGFHELNEEVEDTGAAPAGALGSIRTALRAVAATDWPEALSADAGSFQEELLMFLDALQADPPDAEQLRAASDAAHELYHLFADEAWAHLAEGAGLDEDSGTHEEESEGEMEHTE